MKFRASVVCASLIALGACGTDTENAPSNALPDAGVGAEAGSEASPAAYLRSLPAWPEALPDSNAATGEPTTSFLTGSDGVKYRCTTTPYSLTDTPEKVVSFDPTVDVLWPGALVQGRSYQEGRLAAVPINKRAPITVSIPGLLFDGNSRVVDAPTVATVGSAIGEIIGAAVDHGVAASSSISYQQTTAYSSEQAALSLGVSASYLGGSVDATLDLASSSDLHSVVGYFVQNMFTVTVPQPASPADFFSADLTGADLTSAEANGWIGPQNLPVYVSSVTYGRIMMFSLTSRATTQEIQGALNAQYNGGLASGAVSAKYADLMSNGSTVFKVVTVGGDAANAEAMIASGDPTAFFGSTPALSTAKPISYELRNLGNNSSAKLSETTTYNVQTCVASANGAGANVFVSTFGTTKSVRPYDALGVSMPFLKPVSETGGNVVAYNGVTWAANSDRIYVSRQDGSASPSSIRAYEMDGTPVSLPAGAFGFLGNEYVRKLSYDLKNDRIVAVVNAGVIQQVRFFTADGASVPNGSTPISTGGNNTTSAVYVASKDRLYVGSFNQSITAGKVQIFKLNGEDVTGSSFKLAGGASLPAVYDVAYDSQHDHFLVGGYFQNGKGAVFVFDKNGGYLAKADLDYQVLSVTFDPVKQHIIVLQAGLGGVLLLDPATLAPVPTPNAAFSGIDLATQITFRP